MNGRKKKLPIGIDDFAKLREDDFYYVDKTGMILELVSNWSEVTLFTRPRRFGKSLNMSMLKNFFSVEGDKKIFEGLKIAEEKWVCREYMGKYPVIFLSLKGMDAAVTYEVARENMIFLINDTVGKFQYLLENEKLTDYDKQIYKKLLQDDMNEAFLFNSLRKLSELLCKAYEKKVIILIDEYDVPLAKAFEFGYYDQMTNLIRGLLGQALKTNDSLQFAVMTGCMRIAKESIFTGLNNLKIRSITDVRFDEYFGFTDSEVKTMLEYYECEDSYPTVKEWYDGYRFGNIDVYCPWDVLNYCDTLQDDPKALPQNYWINTSSNDAVKRFIQYSENKTTKREIERLIAGEEIRKEIHQELTYKEMYSDIEHIWSVLFTTGYLTQRGESGGREIYLAIPNMEIRDIFVTQIMTYFKENVSKDGSLLNEFCTALKDGQAEKVEQCITIYLKKTISIRDTFVRKNLKENFYHGILLGILGVKERWTVSSNKETGEGYSDIVIETEDGKTGIIIEVKYAHDKDLNKACQDALRQIDETDYEEELKEEEIDIIRKYGISFYLKRCQVVLGQT